MNKEYNWNEDTVDHFKFMSNYSSRDEVVDAIIEFVDIDCSIEENESEEDLAMDLITKVYNNN
tara:strand:+ start:48 stop:236 length:189 start_codon:yes stop_codon:yes gene_type:complete